MNKTYTVFEIFCNKPCKTFISGLSLEKAEELKQIMNKRSDASGFETCADD